MKSCKIIHCVGDSHVSFFSGSISMQPIWPRVARNVISNFKSYRLGPVLAYNLSETNSQSKGREKLFAVLDEIPKYSDVLLCFGEIDCRVHLVKQAKLQNKNIVEIANECAEKYFKVILEVKKTHNPIIWNTIPSSRKDSIDNKEFPSSGTSDERNKATRAFNECINKLAKAENIPTASIFDDLLDSDGKTNVDYYHDDIHLSQKAMPLALKAITNCGSSILLKTISNIKSIKGIKENILYKYLEKITDIKNNTIALLKKFRVIIKWKMAGSPPPTLHIVKQSIIKKYARAYKIKTFIETGTFRGEMVDIATKIFDQIFSIEVFEPLYLRAVAKFSDFKNITLLHGDSGVIMPTLLASIKSPVLFWLDGHYSAGITSKGELDTPIQKELEAIFKHPIKNHIILIDDARCFDGTNDYPMIDIIEKMANTNNYRFESELDIIRLTSK